MELKFTAEDLRPVIQSVLAELAEQLAPMDDRLAVDEQEAARIIGVQKHVLRDCRLRKEIRAAQVGKRYCYMRRDLATFLEQQKKKAEGIR